MRIGSKKRSKPKSIAQEKIIHGNQSEKQSNKKTKKRIQNSLNERKSE